MIKISPQAYFEPSRGGSRPTEWNIQGRSTVNKPTVMPGLKWEQMGSARFEGSVRSPTIAGAATCLPLSCQMSSVRIAIAKWTVVVKVAAGGLLNGMTEFSMALSPEEMAKRQRFAQTYARSQCPPMLAIERRVCGCDYGGNSLTTRSEANQIAERLGLRAGIRLLEVGAGAGWPGLYFSKITGCEAMLVDLPLSGLRVATDRAAKDRLSSRCWVSVADGSRMPFRDGSFDAVSHSDVLCCMKNKRGLLSACRRVINGSGRMVFTVIWITPGLSPKDHRRAQEGAPEFAECEKDYPTLLDETGWSLSDCVDLTAGYANSIRGFMSADDEFKDGLEGLIGVEAFAERQAGWRLELSAIENGLLRRDLFVAIPALASFR